MEKEMFFVIYATDYTSPYKIGVMHEQYEDAYKEYLKALEDYAQCKICKTIYG